MRPRMMLGRILAPTLAALTVSCSGDRTPLSIRAAQPKLDAVATVTVTGQILGPDGTSICGSLQTELPSVNVMFLGRTVTGITSAQPLCPNDRYAVSVAPGEYTVSLTLWQPTGLVPWIYDEPLTVGSADQVHDITVPAGTRILGRATLDGAPIGGAPLAWVIGGTTGHAVGTSSSVDGTWQSFGRPVVVQNGLSYVFRPCYVLGAQLVSQNPAGPVIIPTDGDRYDCTLKTSVAAGFSHTRTRLVLTVGPGALGYNSPTGPYFDTYGLGWGLQYPVTASTGPSHRDGSVILRWSGLVIGLPGGNLFGTAALRTIGYDASNIQLTPMPRPAITDLGTAGKEIFWQYDDAGVTGAPGLDVSQKSWDGAGGDYILLQYRIRNRGDGPIDIAPGLYMYFIVNGSLAGNSGGTSEDGRLAWVHLDGKYLGSVLLGSPSTPTSRFVPSRSTADVRAALRGEGGLTSLVSDINAYPYVQGSGIVTLKRGQKTDLDVAIVAGMTREELLANAAAAQAEYAGRH